MAKKKNYDPIKLKSVDSPYVYHSRKSKKIRERLELKKYDPVLQRHAIFKEEK